MPFTFQIFIKLVWLITFCKELTNQISGKSNGWFNRWYLVMDRQIDRWMDGWIWSPCKAFFSASSRMPKKWSVDSLLADYICRHMWKMYNFHIFMFFHVYDTFNAFLQLSFSHVYCSPHNSFTNNGQMFQYIIIINDIFQFNSQS
jgi:hypothetical protein